MNNKDGRCLKKYYCKLCHKQISITSGIYGSELCRSCVQKERFKKEKPYNYNKQKRICKQCGKIELVSLTHSHRPFCSQKCYGKSITGKKSLFFKGGKPKCIDCGKEVKNYNSKRCSKCSHQGENSPRYKDGKGREPYAFDFNPKLKESIRKRDNYTCQFCEMTEEEHIKKYDRVLEIHHKDHNRKNSKRNNLITACKKCNLER